MDKQQPIEELRDRIRNKIPLDPPLLKGEEEGSPVVKGRQRDS